MIDQCHNSCLATHRQLRIYMKTARKVPISSPTSARLANLVEWLKSIKNTLIIVSSATRTMLRACKSLIRMMQPCSFLRASSAVGSNETSPAAAGHIRCINIGRCSCSLTQMHLGSTRSTGTWCRVASMQKGCTQSLTAPMPSQRPSKQNRGHTLTPQAV